MTVHLDDWIENFSVPWHRMPQGITTAIAQGCRPSDKDRKEMVRIIVDKMRLIENPKLSQCNRVASKIVRQYCSSFGDLLPGENEIFGNGYEILAAQLVKSKPS